MMTELAAMWLYSGHGGDGGTAGRPFMPTKRERERSSEIKWFKGLGFEPQAHQYLDHHGGGPDLCDQGLERGRRGRSSSITRSKGSSPSFESVHATLKSGPLAWIEMRGSRLLSISNFKNVLALKL